MNYSSHKLTSGSSKTPPTAEPIMISESDEVLSQFNEDAEQNKTCGGDMIQVDEDFEYDVDGTFALTRQPVLVGTMKFLPFRTCNLRDLNGSWYVSISPKSSPYWFGSLNGVLRIEASDDVLVLSGDVYYKPFVIKQFSARLHEGITAKPLVIKKNWYPHFPKKHYKWYFSSRGAKYSRGNLSFKFERHLWDSSAQEFNGSDFGWGELKCKRPWIFLKYPGFPFPSIRISGEMMIGGRKYNITATKTSNFYRGCTAEIDVMTNRSFVSSASSCDGGETFTIPNTYRNSAGFDLKTIVNDTNIPEDSTLTPAELENMLTTHREISSIGDTWRVWVLIGSSIGGVWAGVLGVMFDSSDAPYREGCVIAYDETLSNVSSIDPSARNKKLGEVPLAFLRTTVHEIGHVFNLYHPKHDVHNPPIGLTIMNQTGDIMGAATSTDKYPCNTEMFFMDHNRTSLIHSPDPQVAPGWKNFGWGHGGLWSGVAEPYDVTGLGGDVVEDEELKLELKLPKEVIRGEFIMAETTLKNEGEQDREVSTALNLSEGELKIRVTNPMGDTKDVSDIVRTCSLWRTKILKPKQSFTGIQQLFYANIGHPFDQIGRYTVTAEFFVGEGSQIVRSEPVEIFIRPSISDEEKEIEQFMMDKGLGKSLVFGDFGADSTLRNKLEDMLKKHGDTISGKACAMVLANSLSRDFKDLRSGKVIRETNLKDAEKALDAAMKDQTGEESICLACAVASPREISAPILEKVKKRVSDSSVYKKDDSVAADQILEDHIA